MLLTNNVEKQLFPTSKKETNLLPGAGYRPLPPFATPLEMGLYVTLLDVLNLCCTLRLAGSWPHVDESVKLIL